MYYVESDDKTIFNVGGNSDFTSPAIAAIGVFAIDSSGQIYVADTTNNSILVFPAASSGTAAMPTRTISGTNTLIDNPSGLAVAADGTIYSANYQGNAVQIYPPGANGNVTPTQLTGTASGIVQAFGVAIGPAGQIAVSTQGDGLVIFAPGATGDATPVVHTGMNLDGADSGVCYDPVTSNVYVVRAASDNDVVGFDQYGNQISYLLGSATTLNNPRNCAVSKIEL